MVQQSLSPAQKALNSAYYGMLNVLDPSVAYDVNGKVTAAFVPPPEESHDETADRNPFDGCNPCRLSDPLRSEPFPLLAPDERQDDLSQERKETSARISGPSPEYKRPVLQSKEASKEEAIRAKLEPKGSTDQMSKVEETLLKKPRRQTMNDKSMIQNNSKEPDLAGLVLGSADEMKKQSEKPSTIDSSTGQEMTLAEVEAIIIDTTELSDSNPLLVDYKVSTPLFKATERKDWHAVVYYIRTGSFSYSPMSPSKDLIAGVEAQAQTWVSKKDNSGEKELWCQLPLHAALCLGAPEKVVEMLILANPDALKSPDSHGNLPLHLAYIFEAHVNVVALLVQSFPAGLTTQNNEKHQPIQCSSAIKSNAFQSKSELFSAMSDYTRAVAEHDPDELVHQLLDVQRQLKVINDTIFIGQPERKAEAIKLYHMGKLLVPDNSDQNLQNLASIEERDLSFLERTLNFNFCRVRPETDVIDVTNIDETVLDVTYEAEVVLKKVVADEKSKELAIPVRVKEYCPRTKTWREL